MSGSGRHRAVAQASRTRDAHTVELTSDRSFPRHAHDQFGLGMITHGAHRSWSCIGTVEAGPGDVIMVNPGELHDGMPVNGAVRSWRMIYLSPALLQREAAELGLSGGTTLRPVVRSRPLLERVRHLFQAAAASEPDRLVWEQALTRCLGLLSRHHVLETTAPGPGPVASVGPAVDRLDSAPEVPVTLVELAALCGLGKYQLLRSFHRAVGTTPHAYLIQRRVRLAQALLARGAAPAAAAAESGFADQSHLTRAFVRQLGITPGRYRAALRG